MIKLILTMHFENKNLISKKLLKNILKATFSLQRKNKFLLKIVKSALQATRTLYYTLYHDFI